ncbi:MAG: acetate CoA/acetoacetate CoA-transferase beta subunit [Clostridiales bacterium]|jgi:acetate CoA/acetoacetate CoA-transferase beta subunit|nr:acetate CoA/acetoacetate CoA-transferase beta subunit [Clostridiales bacterium]MDN5281338.1 acetate CoA/acetoacetate CoA-transferase beta subunit [Candidatus Ozemobacter sp.]
MIEDVKLAKQIIAKRIAKEFGNDQIVNLGIGLPTLVANHIPPEVNVYLQSENGIMGMGPAPEPGSENPDITNAGGSLVTVLPHGSYFDSATSFGLIRGSHVEYTVLGALEVDQEGNLASWIIPGKRVPGMGGAMDLVVGARNVIVSTLHTDKGKPKILKKCKLPLTAVKVVKMIVTELGVFKVTSDGLVLTEIHKDSNIEEIKANTEADFKVAENLKTME